MSFGYYAYIIIFIGVLLIIFNKSFAKNAILSQKIAFKREYPPEVEKRTRIIPIILGLFLIITAILNLLGKGVKNR